MRLYVDPQKGDEEEGRFADAGQKLDNALDAMLGGDKDVEGTGRPVL